MNLDELVLSGPAHHPLTLPRLSTRILARRAADLGTPTALGLAILSGLVCATAFPPLSWSMMAWFSLIPLLVACAALSPGRAAIAGMCWTAAICAGVAWCLPTMLSQYFGLGDALSCLIALAVVGLHGLYIAAFSAWVAWLVRRRLAHPILVAGGWLVCELVRSHGEIASPWALTAYSQVGWSSVIQIADLAGPYGIGMLVAAVNAGIAAVLVPTLRGRRPLRSATTIVALLMATALYGQWRLNQSFDDGPALEVAIVQGGAARTEIERSARLARYVALTTDGVRRGDSLIVWPEHAIDAYLEEATPARDSVLRVARATHTDLILGGPHYATSPTGTQYHNSAYLVRGGHLAARYDKQRLVPFAEEDRLAWLLGNRPTSYTRGDGTFVLPASAARLGTLLCLEAMFPDLARRAVAQGAEILVNLSNDAWFGYPEPARHQLEIATLRAVENRRYLVRAAATGFSAVIDPHGRILAETAFAAHQVLHSTVRVSHARTPYQRTGDTFAWLVLAGVAAASLRPLLGRIVTSQP